MNLKSILLIASVFILSSCAELLTIAETVATESALSNQDIAKGLKEALNIGIKEGSSRLSSTDGYYKSVYKILLPEDAQKVAKSLKVIPGFNKVEQVIVEKINRSAEDAAKKAAPIFLSAIREMTFTDAMNILMGSKDAATNYLNKKTYNSLYQEFNPIIVNSLNKFGALDYWSDAVTTYNKIPLVKKANPDIDQYVTQKALVALFDMVEKKELKIRTDISTRTSDILKRVFAKQDNR